MNKLFRYIIITLLVISAISISGCSVNFNTADVTAVYTRNNLTWANAVIYDDSSVWLDLSQGETTVRLVNNVHGNIGYSIYLYTLDDTDYDVELSAKGITVINYEEYPETLAEYDIKCAYNCSLTGNGKRDFVVKTVPGADIRLLVIVEDNNSYPKLPKAAPTIANVKFSAEVLLDGQYPRGDEYTFTLKDESDNILETVHNDDGYIAFSNIPLKDKGTHIFYLAQSEGSDKDTCYDTSVYKIKVDVQDQNVARVYYEKNGEPKVTLPRFTNYKLSKELAGKEDITEYPANSKKSTNKPNYLLMLTISVALLIICAYMFAGRKRGR